MKIYRYYRLKERNRITGEIEYETALLNRQQLKDLLWLSNEIFSDGIDFIIVPYNFTQKNPWVANIDDEDIFEVDDDVDLNGLFTHKKDKFGIYVDEDY